MICNTTQHCKEILTCCQDPMGSLGLLGLLGLLRSLGSNGFRVSDLQPQTLASPISFDLILLLYPSTLNA